MTRLTYTLDEIEGPYEVTPNGTVKFKKKDCIDYVVVTVQLPGGERVPFLFTMKQLVASGKPKSFSGSYLVPSYQGLSFLDPKGRGGSSGYDNVVALPAGGKGDEEELMKDNIKDVFSSPGKITLSVTKSKPETGEVIVGCDEEKLRSDERSLYCFNVIGEEMCGLLVVICYENGDLFKDGECGRGLCDDELCEKEAYSMWCVSGESVE